MENKFQEEMRKERERRLVTLKLRPVDDNLHCCIFCGHPMPFYLEYLCESCESHG